MDVLFYAEASKLFHTLGTNGNRVRNKEEDSYSAESNSCE